ncbi:hypothetical protein [Candidatus Methylocalor cossyra]|uniref:Surface protein-related protein n=1 Tax=Candidatus Methylocalor cossyra TaxID=3108543 RepID=A0ABP1C994_9GAMM
MNGVLRGAALAALLSLAACTHTPSDEKIDVTTVVPEHDYAHPNLDDLLRFADKLAALPAAERLAECKNLRQLHRNDGRLGARLRLLLAQSMTDGCAPLRDTTGLVETSLPEIQDERLRSFLVYHKAILARLDREMERRRALQRQISQILSKEKKAHRRLKSQESELKSQESELRVLQKKLDALKAIEQSLDEPKDGH